MEAEEMSHACKRSRDGGSKIGRQEDEDDEGEGEGAAARAGPGLHCWNHPSSRIYRVSRASGGKDRHSKVYTTKGLRDRRVRLSVSTAIHFYDLQDRLGYDQPSKAIEWLIKAAAAAIAELPTLETTFPGHPTNPEKKHGMGMELIPGDDIQHQQNLSLSSSTSETSKGSVLSLSRSENRIKARDRARERAAKDKEKEQEDGQIAASFQHQPINPSLVISQGSFTELLTGSSNGVAVATAEMNSGDNYDQKPIRFMPDYFRQSGLFGQTQRAHMVPFNMTATTAAGYHPEMQQFSFLQNQPIPITAVGPAGNYNLNFAISPGLAGLNRGTLQSNSVVLSQLPHLQPQRPSSSVDGANMPFFFGAASPATAPASSAENQLPPGFDGRLQICYGDEFRHSDPKGKGKS